MKQQEIAKLLAQAVEIMKSDRMDKGQALARIQVALDNAAFQDHEGQSPFSSRAAGFENVIDSLFVDTLSNAPDYLPKLLPVFALLCGDRDRQVITGIDWSLIAVQPSVTWTTELGLIAEHDDYISIQADDSAMDKLIALRQAPYRITVEKLTKD